MEICRCEDNRKAVEDLKFFLMGTKYHALKRINLEDATKFTTRFKFVPDDYKADQEVEEKRLKMEKECEEYNNGTHLKLSVPFETMCCPQKGTRTQADDHQNGKRHRTT